MNRVATIAGPLFFVAAIGTHWLFGAHAMVRLIGGGCIACGSYWVITRKVPIGIEGQPPSYHLRGAAAVIAGLLLSSLGIAILFYASVAACVLGWSSEC